MRKRQIDTLKIFNANVEEVKESEEYLVKFDSGGRDIVLNVLLGAGFPNEKPKLIVSPILSHPWVNCSTGEVEGAPGILNYTIHSDLGRVVQAISREFERHPPPLVNDPNRESPSHKSLGQAASSNSTSDHPQQRTATASPVVTARSPEEDLFGLRGMTLEELTQLNQDEDYLECFIDKLGFVHNQANEMDMLLTQIETLSVNNLSKKKIIEERKQKLDEMTLGFRELGVHYEESMNKYQKLAEDFSPQHIKELLQIAVSTADAKSDEEAQRFLNGDSDVNTFLSNFIQSRKSYTMRKAKEERLSQQLTALERAAF
ncbi:vacuolar protein sorting-associated protein 37A-like [Uranotaenia lowii]|uniref:vacuolar protein sorting-associated protein 37A-like n=1 Tax=Uranotaenia lowii TaxID=190385 RepID=UPI00247AE235|nr:vacuolar protein sorting-associated protein 37A-like [Uranotaenia lowii]